jgi:integrase
LPAPAQALLAGLDSSTGLVFATPRGNAIDNLDAAMRSICSDLGVERTRPHDLRRTHGTTIAALGFGREAMNRVQNHREGGIADVYDRHRYEAENKKVMEAVAARIMALAEGRPGTDNIVPMRVGA